MTLRSVQLFGVRPVVCFAVVWGLGTRKFVNDREGRVKVGLAVSS